MIVPTGSQAMAARAHPAMCTMQDITAAAMLAAAIVARWACATQAVVARADAATEYVTACNLSPGYARQQGRMLQR